MQGRSKSLDIAKGLGVILVIVGHLSIEQTLSMATTVFVYSYHVALLFFISGYLYKYREFKIAFPYYLKKLVLPCYIMLIVDLLRNYFIYSKFEISDINLKTLAEVLLFINRNFVTNAPIWFFMALFLLSSLQSLIKNNTKITIALMVVFFIILTLKWYPVMFMDWFGSIPMTFLFFASGTLVRKTNFSSLAKKRDFKQKVAIMISEFFLLLAFALLNGRVDIAAARYGDYYLLTILTGFIGTDMTLIFSNLTQNYKFTNIFVFFSRHSKTIMLTHLLITPFLSINSFIMQIIFTVVILVFYYIILSLMVERRNPFKLPDYENNVSLKEKSRV